MGALSSLRVLSFEPRPITNSATLQYMDTNSSYEMYMGADTGSLLSPVEALFLSAMAAPPTMKASSSDPWGNLKIPMLETVPAYSEERAQTWLSVIQIHLLCILLFSEPPSQTYPVAEIRHSTWRRHTGS